MVIRFWAVWRWMQKVLKSTLNRHRKTAFLLLMQTCFFLFYIQTFTQNQATRNADCTQTLESVVISPNKLKIDSGNSSNRTLDVRSGAKGVRIIQHLHQGKTQTGVTAAADDDDNVDANCSLESYLSHNQDACVSVLNKSTPTEAGYHYEKDTSCDLESVDTSCHSTRKAFLFGKEQITREETNFPLAFAIKLHGFANQAYRLLRYIYRRHNFYCIHVDKKAADEVYQSFKRISRCFDNIVVIEDRIEVIYSSIRHVEAEKKCLEAAKGSNVNWKYYINLTGQEFMLKTNLELVKFLISLNGSNDIESNKIPGDMMHRTKQKAVITRDKVVVSRERKAEFERKMELRKGGAYGMFSRDFVNFILNHPIVSEFIDWLADTYAPEETIWASLNALPGAPGGFKGYRTGSNGIYRSRAVKWSWDRSNRCHGKYVHWICIYGTGDLQWLLDNNQMVANKFYESYEPLALTCLEMVMYQRLVK